MDRSLHLTEKHRSYSVLKLQCNLSKHCLSEHSMPCLWRFWTSSQSASTGNLFNQTGWTTTQTVVADRRDTHPLFWQFEVFYPSFTCMCSRSCTNFTSKSLIFGSFPVSMCLYTVMKAQIIFSLLVLSYEKQLPILNTLQTRNIYSL